MWTVTSPAGMFPRDNENRSCGRRGIGDGVRFFYRYYFSILDNLRKSRVTKYVQCITISITLFINSYVWLHFIRQIITIPLPAPPAAWDKLHVQQPPPPCTPCAPAPSCAVSPPRAYPRYTPRTRTPRTPPLEGRCSALHARARRTRCRSAAG